MGSISSHTMKHFALALLALLAISGCSAMSTQEVIMEGAILKEHPALGTLPPGMVVYVDDGRCPEGEITELVGGSASQGIPRRERCVKRPK